MNDNNHKTWNLTKITSQLPIKALLPFQYILAN